MKPVYGEPHKISFGDEAPCRRSLWRRDGDAGLEFPTSTALALYVPGCRYTGSLPFMGCRGDSLAGDQDLLSSDESIPSPASSTGLLLRQL